MAESVDLAKPCLLDRSGSAPCRVRDIESKKQSSPSLYLNDIKYRTGLREHTSECMQHFFLFRSLISSLVHLNSAGERVVQKFGESAAVDAFHGLFTTTDTTSECRRGRRAMAQIPLFCPWKRGKKEKGASCRLLGLSLTTIPYTPPTRHLGKKHEDTC